jgi:hypothetical protein
MRTFIRRASWLSWLVACFSLIVIPAANAYIDPGSGSFIFQMIVGAALGVSFGVKLFWRRIRSFFTRTNPTDEE